MGSRETRGGDDDYNKDESSWSLRVVQVGNDCCNLNHKPRPRTTLQNLVAHQGRRRRSTKASVFGTHNEQKQEMVLSERPGVEYF